MIINYKLTKGDIENFHYKREYASCMEVEDEKHFVMSCSKLEICRKSFYDKMSDIYPTLKSMNISDMFTFISYSKYYDLNVLCMSFISELYNERNSLVVN